MSSRRTPQRASEDDGLWLADLAVLLACTWYHWVAVHVAMSEPWLVPCNDCTTAPSAARWTGVLPLPAFAVGSAPLSTNNLATSVVCAVCNGVKPPDRFAWILAFARSNRCTIATSPTQSSQRAVETTKSTTHADNSIVIRAPTAALHGVNLSLPHDAVESLNAAVGTLR